MASSSRRSLKAPRFFKVIMDPEADQLPIPIGFLERYGRDLPSSVALKSPGGSSVEVEVGHSDGRTCLQKGWPEFRDRYSIGFGHFLVFELKHSSRFSVSVFDMSTTEINYHLSDLESFKKTLKTHHFSRLNIPKDFAMRNGIVTKTSLRLVNEQGGKWQTKVHVTEEGSRISMQRGWTIYRKENNLAAGMTLKFVYDNASSTFFVIKESSV